MTEEELIKLTPVAPEPQAITRSGIRTLYKLCRDSWRYGWAEGYRAALLSQGRGIAPSRSELVSQYGEGWSCVGPVNPATGGTLKDRIIAAAWGPPTRTSVHDPRLDVYPLAAAREALLIAKEWLREAGYFNACVVLDGLQQDLAVDLPREGGAEEQNDEKDDGAALLPVDAPASPTTKTEALPNSESIKAARIAVRQAVDDYIDGGFSACIIEHNIDNLIAAVKADIVVTELPAWFTRGALDELAEEYDPTHRRAIVESLKHEIRETLLGSHGTQSLSETSGSAQSAAPKGSH